MVLNKKHRINIDLVKRDLKFLNDEQVNEICGGFLLQSFDLPNNEYNFKDCRKAVNLCIEELQRRGYEDEVLLTWGDDHD